MTRVIKQDLGIAAALFAAALVSRIPFRAQALYNWDSVNFALGLEDFDILLHKPHPPGYILYIALGRLVDLFAGDPVSTLVGISIVSSALGAAGIYLLGRSIFDRSTGLTAAILLIFSPLAWFYGEVGLSYGFELPLIVAATWFLYQVFFHRRYVIAAAVLIGLAGGFRQDALVYLGPFLLVGSLRVDRKRMLISWGAMLLSILAWLIPLTSLAGGLSGLRDSSRAQYDTGIYPTSWFAEAGIDNVINNLHDVWLATVWLFGLASILLLFIPGLFFMPERLREDRRLLFLLLLPVPACLFFLFFHFGQYGYLLVYGTPLILLAARVLLMIAGQAGALVGDVFKGASERALKHTSSALAAVLLLGIAFFNTNLFIKGDHLYVLVPIENRSVREVFGPFSRGGIRQSDKEIQAAVDVLDSLDPETTIIVSVSPFPRYTADARRLMYYLPRFRIVQLKLETGVVGLDVKGHGLSEERDTGSREVELAPEISRLAFVGVIPGGDESLDAQAVTDHEASVPITIVELPDDGRLEVDFFTFERSTQS